MRWLQSAVIRRTAGWRAAMREPVDAAWLAALRALFGLAMCVSMLRFIAYGWVHEFFVAPRFHFKYLGFAWVEPLSPTAMHALFWALAALALCVAVGLCFRVAAVGFTLGFGYLQLVDVTNYLNHYYLGVLLAGLLAVSPAGRVWSIDAWLDRGAALHRVSGAWHALFRFQIGVVYTFAGLAKAQGDWLVDAQPLRIWLGARTGLPGIGWLLRHDDVALIASWSGFLFDTFVVWFLLFKRTRPFAFAAVLAFHALTGVLFPIGMFPVFMVVGALVFFSPSWPREVLRVLLRVAGRPAPVQGDREEASKPGNSTPALSGWRKLGWSAAALYCLVQLALPLRFLAYGGDVRWHEQGMRLSWRVMVREKNGSTTFVVRSVASGRVWHVAPSAYLTRLQEREMAGQPDLILQLAHHIRDDFAARGLGPVEVRADSIASLNGRPAARLIDPEVDLAATHDGIAPARWILPSPTSRPRRIRPI
jgi:vitamin K-dependent gamma-carboxylase